MKKNIILILSVCLLTSLFTSFKTNKTVTINGYIHSYGNEPFAYPGIVTDNKKEYAIECSDEIKSELLNNQGVLIEMKGIIYKKGNYTYKLKDGVIEITEWKKIE